MKFKKYLVPFAAIIITISIVIFVLQSNTSEQTLADKRAEAQEQVLAVINNGIDLSNSLYPEEDFPLIKEKIEVEKDKILSEGLTSEHQIYAVATWYYTAKDYQGALDLYQAADLFETEQQDYRISRAVINRTLGNIEQARLELDQLKLDWPVPSTFLELADTYKLIPDTPDYIIDDIYLEGISRSTKDVEVLLLAAINWFQETGRDEMAIPYIQDYLNYVNDPAMEQELIRLQNQS